MIPGSTVLILEVGSIGDGARIVQEAPTGSEVVEFIPTCGGCIVALTGEAALLGSFQARNRQARASRLIAAVPEAVIQAWLGLVNPPLDEVLWVFESPSAADVFQVAVDSVAAGLRPFDLRILRGGEPRAYVFVTGPRSSFAPSSEMKGTWTRLESPRPLLRQLFEVGNP